MLLSICINCMLFYCHMIACGWGFLCKCAVFVCSLIRFRAWQACKTWCTCLHTIGSSLSAMNSWLALLLTLFSSQLHLLQMSLFPLPNLTFPAVSGISHCIFDWYTKVSCSKHKHITFPLNPSHLSSISIDISPLLPLSQVQNLDVIFHDLLTCANPCYIIKSSHLSHAPATSFSSHVEQCDLFICDLFLT